MNNNINYIICCRMICGLKIMIFDCVALYGGEIIKVFFLNLMCKLCKFIFTLTKTKLSG